MTTVCAECRWCTQKRGSDAHWSDWQCRHPEVQRPSATDPVTGETKFIETVSCCCLVDSASPPCRDINKGDCLLFELRRGVWASLWGAMKFSSSGMADEAVLSRPRS
jgi:hypothetical protein